MFAFGFCETACLRGLQGTAKERIGDMDKEKEIELKVQMFCAAVRSKDRTNFFGMKRLSEDINESFEVLKENGGES